MRDALKKLIKPAKMRMKAWRTAFSNSLIYFFYYHVQLKKNYVFLESRSGKDFTGNILRISEELSKEEYKDLKLYLWVHDKTKWAEVRKLCENYHIRLKLIRKEFWALCVMECAQYIVSDSGLPYKYVKRDGQIVLDTWHGTPLKVMGYRVKAERKCMGSLQHYFMSCDYRLFPNDFMRDIMMQAYMVGELQTAKLLMSGYPRNSVFFDQNRREDMRKRLGYDGKQVFAYMPTHRGNASARKNEGQLADVLPMLSTLDARLRDDQVLLVKLHVFNQSKIDFSAYAHIKPFPSGYETYDVLNTADCLITDYSSVFFDFANSRRKIILFAYDEQQYFEDRGGTYFPLSDMPFPVVRDIEALWQEMQRDKEYDDEAFVAQFCTYDSADAVQKLCRHVFKREQACREEPYVYDGKDNVLIYGGSLMKNGITTALNNVLEAADKNEKNYYVAFYKDSIVDRPERMDAIPEGIGLMPIYQRSMLTLLEKIQYHRVKKSKKPIRIPARLLRGYQREMDRYYYHARFTRVLQFDGYGMDVNLLYAQFAQPKAIWVHNDMVQEMKTRGNQNVSVLRYAYQTYDLVAIVNDLLAEPTQAISGRKDNIVTVNNVFDARRIQRRAEEPITFQNSTALSAWNPEGLEGALRSKGIKFVTVGRFSPEKGHARLIGAFNRFCEEHPDAQLIIIGGHGVLYGSTLALIRRQKYWRNITVIRSIDNPFSIVKRCDCFVLSSLYEGLPLVIWEASALELPVISTNIPACRDFMISNGGTLVENSEDGLLQGMRDYADGKVKPMYVDYQACYQQSVAEFEKIVNM